MRVRLLHPAIAFGLIASSLWVVSPAGASEQATRMATALGPSAACSSQTELLSAGSPWSWYFGQSEPGKGWSGEGFDDSAWAVGAAPLGFTAKGTATNIDSYSGSNRPRVAYFRSEFEVPLLTGAETFKVDTVADDGVILYVNGVEVGRSNVIDGPDRHDLYASSSYLGPVSFDVPASLLREGRNEISASVHLNYRKTRAVAFDAAITAYGLLAGRPEPEPDPDPTEPPTSSGSTTAPSETPTATPTPSSSATTPAASVPSTVAPTATTTTTAVDVSGTSSAVGTTISIITPTSSVAGVPSEGVLPVWGAPVWRDEFNGTTVNTALWRIRDKTRVSYDQAIISASQVKVGGGVLSIRTDWLAAAVADAQRPRWFNTGYIDTIGLFSQKYGRWEMRAKLPLVQDASRGIWPAFWLRDSKGLGEIDIMEAIGAPHDQLRVQPQGSFSSTVHQSTNHEPGTVRITKTYTNLPTVIGGYHTWALEWDPSGMRFYYDNQLVYAPTTKDNPWFNTAFTDAGVNIRIDTQVGHEWMGYADPARKQLTQAASYDIDYVRVWKYNG